MEVFYFFSCGNKKYSYTKKESKTERKKKMNKTYYVFHTDDSDVAPYGKVAIRNPYHHEKNENFIEMAFEHDEDNTLTVPRVDVLEIAEEEYTLLKPYANGLVDTENFVPKLIKMILEKKVFQMTSNKKRKQRQMERNVSWNVTIAGEEELVFHYIAQELLPYATEYNEEYPICHINDEEINPLLSVEFMMESKVKNIYTILNTEKHKTLHVQFQYKIQ